MGSRMIATIVIAIAFFMIGSNNVHCVTAQLCGANLSELMSECKQYFEPNSPPPSESCCALIRPIDLACACRYATGDVTKLGVDVNKVVSSIRSCGIDIPPSYKCGSYTVPGLNEEGYIS